ncbi:hypothetical protein [Nonlabens ponticola]|uniref:Uncharacterized protein n=1 Tax=Nonlabens ponticola TaxID=2496866 RepID=A0A3S9MUQ6_9FLAO|nr:hypothetical protein [Nonlabens ponticola]AZQ42870.1 hypothetical protein EJ995_00940 [Nonlabens ponticola]
MYKLFKHHLLPFYFILAGCTSTTSTSIREFHVFASGKPIPETFEMTESTKEDGVSYYYLSLSDDNKDVEILYDADKLGLYFAADQYLIKNTATFKESGLETFEFGIYSNIQKYNDATGPIIFNADYGLLAILNSHGPDVIVLPNNTSSKSAETIRRQINSIVYNLK